MEAERYISARDALGPARIERLFALGPAIDPIRRLTDNAEFIEMASQRISKLQLSRLTRSHASNPDENWAAVELTDGTYLCVDDASRNVNDTNLIEAVLFPQLHMNLVSWWLMHAWRTVELVTTCARNLDEWNLNVAAILARSLIEEVGCLLYEAKAISACWSQLKHLPALDRPLNVRNELHPILMQFKFANRGLELGAEVKATSVLTYVDKLQKASGLTGLREQYDWLSNAAHPAFGSRIAYMGPPAIHDSDAISQWRLSRMPATFQGHSADLEFKLAHIATDACTDVAPLGAEILWQSLRFVDDFGLTTKAYRFTDRKYWRKLRPRSSQPECPCGCGRTTRTQHRWGSDAPSIEIPSVVASADDSTGQARV